MTFPFINRPSVQLDTYRKFQALCEQLSASQITQLDACLQDVFKEAVKRHILRSTHDASMNGFKHLEYVSKYWEWCESFRRIAPFDQAEVINTICHDKEIPESALQKVFDHLQGQSKTAHLSP